MDDALKIAQKHNELVDAVLNIRNYVLLLILCCFICIGVLFKLTYDQQREIESCPFHESHFQPTEPTNE